MKLSLRHVAAIVVFAVLALPPMIASSSSSGVSAPAVAAPADTQQLRPVIPGADRYQEGKVFLEHADTWSYLEQPGVAPRFAVSGAYRECGVSQKRHVHVLRQRAFL